MFRTQNLCPGSKNVFNLYSRQKNFLFSEQQNLFPQHMFPARLNWETFASATMFPSLARPLDSRTRTTASTRLSHRTAAMSARKPTLFWLEKPLPSYHEVLQKCSVKNRVAVLVFFDQLKGSVISNKNN